MGIHARRTVHWRDDQPPDENSRETRRQERRNAHRDSVPHVSNTGAYGNHGGETLANGMSGPWAIYKCPNKKGDGYAVYTNTALRRRFSRLRDDADVLCDGVGDRRIRAHARHRSDRVSAQEHGPRERQARSGFPETSDLTIGSYGLDQCIDAVEKALTERPRARQTGRGPMARRQRHRDLDARLRAADRTAFRLRVRTARGRPLSLHVGSTEIGNGLVPRNSRSSRRSWAARRRAFRSERRHRQNAVRQRHLRERRHDGADEGGRICRPALRENILAFAARATGEKIEHCRVDDGRVICGRDKIR